MLVTSFIEKYKPCLPSRTHMTNKGYIHMAQAWDECEDLEWLFWTCNALKLSYDKRKLAAKFVREIWDLLQDERSKAAIIAIENDCLTSELLNAAYAAYAAAAADAAYDAAADAAYDAAADAAYDAAYDADAADAAYDAAAAAAYDAAYDADAADAADAAAAAAAAYAAADAAAYAAYATYAATYAAAAAADNDYSTMRKKQVEILKAFIPNPFK
jgi:hypothetical protein